MPQQTKQLLLLDPPFLARRVCRQLDPICKERHPAPAVPGKVREAGPMPQMLVRCLRWVLWSSQPGWKVQS